MEKVLFKEEQRFGEWWMWVLIASAFLIPILFIACDLARSDDTIEVIFPLVVIVGIGLVVTWFIGRMKLFVEITYEEIRFHFPPLLSKWKTINKSEIEKFEVRTYKPIREYGGWGIKGGTKNKAYNVSGNIGLQLELRNGRKILLGTQKKQAIERAMNKLMNNETNN